MPSFENVAADPIRNKTVIQEVEAVIGPGRTITVKADGTRLLRLEVPDATPEEWNEILTRIDRRWPRARING